MLGGDRAAELGHRVVDDAVDRLALGHQRLRADVVVDVAVADVAEGIGPHLREARRELRADALDELRGLRHRHRDVVLHVGELRLGHGLADAPERPRLLAALREQLDRGGRPRERDPCRRAGAGLRIEPQHRGGDDAERAFGAEEQLLQVVAGVVLAQPAQAVPDAAVGQHHLETEHLLARGAVAQDVDAAGVGREVAADLAAAFCGERKRK